MGLASSAEYIEKAVESSLKNLGVKQIDLYYVHRPLPTLDVTEVVSTMKKLKDAGKIK